MKYRQLGRSGIRVSAITLGALPFGGHQRKELGRIELSEARRMVDMALDAGVNLIDTADVYGLGRSEETVGALIQGRRDRAFIATKCRAVVGDGPNDGGLSRHHIIKSAERSLQRLGTDHIDLYQAHGWDGDTSIDETLRAFDQLVADGKVRYVGCSNYSAWHVMKALSRSEILQVEPMVSQQITYNLVCRDVENELIPLSLDQGLGILVWGPLAAGVLSGKYVRGTDAQRLRSWREPPITDPDRVFQVVDVARRIGERLGASPAQVALAWLLARPGVSSVIVGPRSLVQLESALAAVDLQLTTSDVGELDDVSAVPRPYPQWHQAWSAIDRPGSPDKTVHRPVGRLMTTAPKELT